MYWKFIIYIQHRLGKNTRFGMKTCTWISLLELCCGFKQPFNNFAYVLLGWSLVRASLLASYCFKWKWIVGGALCFLRQGQQGHAASSSSPKEACTDRSQTWSTQSDSSELKRPMEAERLQQQQRSTISMAQNTASFLQPRRYLQHCLALDLTTLQPQVSSARLFLPKFPIQKTVS